VKEKYFKTGPQAYYLMLTLRFISNINYNYVQMRDNKNHSSIIVKFHTGLCLKLKFTKSKSCQMDTVTSLLVPFSKTFGSQNLRDQIPNRRQLYFSTFYLLYHCNFSFDTQNPPLFMTLSLSLRYQFPVNCSSRNAEGNFTHKVNCRYYCHFPDLEFM